jgi:hypothetical protein
MLRLSRAKIQLSPAELGPLRAAVERDAPEFAHRLANPIEVDRLEQPWFRRHRVLDVQSAVPFPARRLHVAVGPDGAVRVLTARLANLQAVAADDPPLDLDDEENAEAYAAYGNAWTSAHALGELKLGSFGEIPWHASLDEGQRRVIEEVRARWGASIQPETRRRGPDGWAFHSWWLAMGKLIERELVVPRDGRLRRTDQVHAAELPVPPGNHWQFVNGRLLPVG